VDIAKRHCFDFTACFYPAISPDLNKIAFCEFYGRFTPMEHRITSMKVIVIDEDKPEALRVYPKKTEEDTTAEGFVHNFLGYMLWSTNGKKIYFFEGIGPYADWDRCTFMWTVLDFNAGYNNASATAYKINPDNYLRPSTGRRVSGYETIPNGRLEWADSETVAITPDKELAPLYQSVPFYINLRGELVQWTKKEAPTEQTTPATTLKSPAQGQAD
jgi:hypothetical protein